MSEYFKFYLAKKNKNEVFESLGPWGMKDNKLIPMPLVVRSRSYMNGLRENLGATNDSTKVEESIRNIFGDEEYFEVGWIAMEDILNLAKTKGFKEGYVLKEKLDYIYKNQDTEDDYDLDIYDDEYVSIRRYAEMSEKERKLYAYHRWIDLDSKEYLADILATVALSYYNANIFNFLDYLPMDKLYLLVHRG